jgi:polyisoprenoid-binding protein YceI
LIVAVSASAACWAPIGMRGEDPETLLLVASESRIHFIGIKNNAVAVPGSFAGLTGALDVVGHRGWVEIEIASLATGDEKRDQTMVKHLFGGAEYPLARFAIKDASGATELPVPGSSVELQVTGLLSLRGIETPLELDVRLTREGADRVRVQTLGPLVLTQSQLQLEGFFELLKAVCGHEALSGAVPVQLDLVFAAER